MNAKQLIEKLQKLPPNLMVVVSGYEAGVNEIGGVQIKKANLNQNTAWYYGAHEIDESGDTEVAYIQ